MSTVRGKYILMTVDEFAQYIDKTRFTRPVKLIQEHHTAIPGYKEFDGKNHFERLIRMEEYHVKNNGMAQIAQNVTTFPDSMVALCRDINIAPAGIYGQNTYGLCIENFGNFDVGKDVMNEAHKNAIVAVTAILCKRFRLTPSTDTIVYHHWFDLNTGKRTNGTGVTKTCPGTNFFGGNRVEDAAKNFIPLVAAKLEEYNGKT